MSRKFVIVMQTEGRGDAKQEVPIKRIGFRPGEVKGKGSKKKTTVLKTVKFFPIKFPLLKVVVGAAGMEGFIEINWSNFHSETALNPGKFSIKHVVQRPLILYVTEAGRKRMFKGRPQVDQLEMAKQYGTEYTPTSVIYADNHPMERAELWKIEHETIAGLANDLHKRFGQKLAVEIVNLFASHDLFLQFVKTTTRKAA